MTWTWRFENADGQAVDAEHALSNIPAGAGTDAARAPAFPNQGDAESWLGENWRALHAAGVAGATLLEEQRVVYGPLGLAPD